MKPKAPASPATGELLPPPAAGSAAWQNRMRDLREREAATVALLEKNTQVRKEAAAESLLYGGADSEARLKAAAAEDARLRSLLEELRFAIAAGEERLKAAEAATREERAEARRQRIAEHEHAMQVLACEVDIVLAELAVKLRTMDEHRVAIATEGVRSGGRLRVPLCRALIPAGLGDYFDIPGRWPPRKLAESFNASAELVASVGLPAPPEPRKRHKYVLKLTATTPVIKRWLKDLMGPGTSTTNPPRTAPYRALE